MSSDTENQGTKHDKKRVECESYSDPDFVKKDTPEKREGYSWGTRKCLEQRKLFFRYTKFLFERKFKQPIEALGENCTDPD